MDGRVVNRLDDRRREVQRLLSASDPGDALASYYALWHDPRRTKLVVHYDVDGTALGFLTASQTGVDLFRPLITLRAPDADVVGALVESSLARLRPYSIIVPMRLASYVRDHLEVSQPAWERIYQLDPSRFQPIINVLVQRVAGPDKAPRYQIESQGKVVAVSGTNWRSPAFAEVFVVVHPSGRGRGWGKSVVSACIDDLLAAKVRPLYSVQEGNSASIHLAEALGFVDTGRRQFTAHVTLLP